MNSQQTNWTYKHFLFVTLDLKNDSSKIKCELKDINLFLWNEYAVYIFHLRQHFFNCKFKNYQKFFIPFSVLLGKKSSLHYLKKILLLCVKTDTDLSIFIVTVPLGCGKGAWCRYIFFLFFFYKSEKLRFACFTSLLYFFMKFLDTKNKNRLNISECYF